MLSRTRALLRSLTLIAAASAAAASFGIVATTTYGATLDTMYPSVGYVDSFGGSGVAVGPNVFLTAGHVVGGGFSNNNSPQTFTLLGTTYSINRSVAAPDILVTDPNSQQFGQMTHVDLSLVYVNGTFPTYTSVGPAPILNSGLTMVGYGQTGGVNAPGTPGYYPGYYTNFTTTNRLSGTNVFDGTADLYVAPGTTGNNSAVGGPNLISFLRQAGDAMLGGGDSGGGWFQGNSLIGISTGYVTTNDKLPGFGFASNNNGVPYWGSAAIDLNDTRLASFMSSVRVQATPEPTSIAALGLGTMALLRRRRRA